MAKKNQRKVEASCGKVTGPIQFAFPLSVDRVTPQTACITRKCVTSLERAAKVMEKSDELQGEMGQKHFLPYALFVGKAWLDPHWASRTRFSYGDFKLFLQACLRMFEFDRTAARGHMCMRRLIVFEHPNPLGSVADFVLFGRVKVAKNDGVGEPAGYGDYQVESDFSSLPDGIAVHDLESVGDLSKMEKVFKRGGVVDRRFDLLLIFDVENGNPNGDPDADNQPRINPNGHAYVTDVCLKRKIRNAIRRLAQEAKGYRMFIATEEDSMADRILSNKQQEAYDQREVIEAGKVSKEQQVALAQGWMCKTFFDVRWFGAIMSTGAKTEESDDE